MYGMSRESMKRAKPIHGIDRMIGAGFIKDPVHPINPLDKSSLSVVVPATPQ